MSQAKSADSLTYRQQSKLPLSTASTLPPAPLLHQRYRLIETIGQGGMGTVYSAQDIQLADRLVALKEMNLSQLSLQDFPLAMEQFRHEAHLLASLRHSSLPAIYDYFTENGRWYLVMSFIEGQNLQAILRTTAGGRLPINEVVRIGIELCEVLEYLHTHEPPIIFRDLKPSNIMMTPNGHICLIDFGIARYFKQEQANDTAHFSSVGYTSPEQYGLLQTRPRSDLYSLGATLHQMLSGHNPAHRPFQFSALYLVDPKIPFSLAKLIMQMVQMDEQNRPESAAVVKQQLEQLLILGQDGSIWSTQTEHAVDPEQRVLPSKHIDVSQSVSTPPPQTMQPLQEEGLRSRSLLRRSVLVGLVGGIIVAGGGVFVWSNETKKSSPHSAPVQAKKKVPATPTARSSTLWSNFQRITGKASQTTPALATSSNGTLFLAFVANNSGNGLLSTSSQDNGTTWGTILDTGQSCKTAPALAVSASGTLDLIFMANNSGNGLMSMSSQDNGATWGNVPYTGQNSNAAPALAVSASGTLHLVCMTNDGSNGLVHMSSQDNGATWSIGEPIPGQFSKTAPALAIAKNGTLYLVFTANNDGNGLMSMSSQDSGATWSTTYYAGQSSLLAPALAVLNNTLYLAYVASDGSNRLCVVSSQDGLQWSSPQETGQLSLLAPALAVLNKTLYLAYVASDGSNQLCIISSQG